MALSLNEMALILIALLIGFVLGMLVSGRGKYKRLWREEQLAHQRALRPRESLDTERPDPLLHPRNIKPPDTSSTSAAVRGDRLR